MSDDTAPDPLANLDQTLRGLVDVGRVIFGYYAAMLTAGFTEPQAFALTLAYQRNLLRVSDGE